MNVDFSKIPRLAERRDAAAKHAALVKASNDLWEEQGPARSEIDDAFRPKFKAIADREVAAVTALRQQFQDERAKLLAERDAAYSASALQTAYDAAEAAYNDESVPVVLTENDGDDNECAQKCALSGEPLLDGDELLADEDTGELVLRCLLLPPRPVDTEATADAA